MRGWETSHTPLYMVQVGFANSFREKVDLTLKKLLEMEFQVISFYSTFCL